MLSAIETYPLQLSGVEGPEQRPLRADTDDLTAEDPFEPLVWTRTPKKAEAMVNARENETQGNPTMVSYLSQEVVGDRRGISLLSWPFHVNF